jgi:hypothetical protein
MMQNNKSSLQAESIILTVVVEFRIQCLRRTGAYTMIEERAIICLVRYGERASSSNIKGGKHRTELLGRLFFDDRGSGLFHNTQRAGRRSCSIWA